MSFATQLADECGGAVAKDLYTFEPTDMAQVAASGSPAVFVVSCFGRGEAPDAARKFMTYIMSDAAPRLEKLRYTVFGLGNSQTHAQWFGIVGKQLDARLEALGATRFFPKGTGDDSGCIEMDFEAWKTDLLQHMKDSAVALAAVPDAPATASACVDAVETITAACGPDASEPVRATRGATCETQATSTHARPLHTAGKPDPYHSEDSARLPFRVIPSMAVAATDVAGPAGATAVVVSAMAAMRLAAFEPQLSSNPQFSSLRVTQTTNLTPRNPRAVYEMHLASDAAYGPTSRQPVYATGDHVAIMPENSDMEVERLSRASSIKLPFTDATDVGTALRLRVDFNGAVTPQTLRLLAASATNSAEADALRSLSDRDAYIRQVRGQHVRLLPLLHRFKSTHLPLDRLLATMPPLMPRYYSISSPASAAAAGEMSVTFRHHRVMDPSMVPGDDGTGDRSLFDGLCSSYLARCETGDRVRVAVRHSFFTPPVDPSAPIVMVAGGIGIAPFRAFLVERIARAREMAGAKMAPALLLYGCRDADDEVYRGLMEEAVHAGALTAFDIGHAAPDASGGTGRARRVDDIMHAHADFIGSAMVDAGSRGFTYVCGGATGFGRAVATTMRAIVKQRRGLDDAAADAAMAQLLAENRFLEDLAD